MKMEEQEIKHKVTKEQYEKCMKSREENIKVSETIKVQLE